FEGYMAPAIRKDGTKTALAFATEDPDNPGTIQAVAGADSAGIGGVMYMDKTPNSTGNIQINSGNIIATGGDQSAGIGGGLSGGVDNITINGGNVSATGDGGAGIGSGVAADATNITINGGTVSAISDVGAGIGGGRGAEQTGVTINNGKISAVSQKGAGIGIGGQMNRGRVVITICNGTIHAECKTGAAPAIGANATMPVIISIYGGIIDAVTTNGMTTIGSTGEDMEEANEVVIKGGTIITSNDGDSESYQIGFPGDGVVWIYGGSIFADRISNARFEDNNLMHRVGIEFDGVSRDGIKVSSIEFRNMNFDYSTEGICTSNGGKIFLWMPWNHGGQIVAATVGGTEYVGGGDIAYEELSMHPAEGNEVFKEGGVLLAKMTAKGKRSLVVSWNEVAGAAGYEVFLGQCGDYETTEKCMLITTVKTGGICKETMDGLKAKTAYRAYVKAYKTDFNGKKVYIEESPVIHAFTTGWTKTYTNPKSVTVKKTKLTLTAGKTAKIRASVTKVKKGKKLIPMTHAAKLRYLSSDEEIATVDGSGKIEAKAAGICKIYVFAANGVSKAVNVTVK
ncbi:MAG: Ig-like domain-containing protein, partial [Firmicutes bacterium]|nr:Ig-like domain-containing protein [Bacillota bacterium]